MCTKHPAINRKDTRKGPICFNTNKSIASFKRSGSEENDTRVLDNSSYEEDLHIDSDDWDFEYQLGNNKYEDTEVDFWKRLLLLEAGWYKNFQERDNPVKITEEIDRTLQKMKLEESPRDTIMGNIRAKIYWMKEDDGPLVTANPTLSLDFLSIELYHGLGLDKLESFWHEMALRALSV
ncbi:hypothetical protein N7456_005931 [Penicillium angulare]|uniref:Uncharacterized protein n=1 Tax=Penicillium angulare TaxID=116970 RepID=A0A9W9FZC1_9EURO|nr:hypothetical protein N7456_005931 [Penicillium angulare]